MYEAASEDIGSTSEADEVIAKTGPGAPNPYMPPPLPNTGQQPHIPQNFKPTGRKKALICACNYRCPLAGPETQWQTPCFARNIGASHGWSMCMSVPHQPGFSQD